MKNQNQKDKIEDFKKMKKGDIVLVKRDNSTIALVEIIDNDTKLYGKKINNRTINYYQHNIRIYRAIWIFIIN